MLSVVDEKLTFVNRVWRSTIALSAASCYIMWGEFSLSQKLGLGELRTLLTRILYSDHIPSPVASPYRTEDDKVAARLRWWELIWD